MKPENYILIILVCLLHYIFGYFSLLLFFPHFDIAYFASGALFSIVIGYVFYFLAKEYSKYRNNNWRFSRIIDSLFAWILGGLHGCCIFFALALPLADSDLSLSLSTVILWGINCGGLFGAIFGAVFGGAISSILNNDACAKSHCAKKGRASFASFLELAVLGILVGTILDCVICLAFGFMAAFAASAIVIYQFVILYIIALKILDYASKKYLEKSA